MSFFKLKESILYDIKIGYNYFEMKEFKKWKTHNITTNDSKDNYISDAKLFYELLKREHQKHIEESQKEKNSFREISLIKSPMTILNGKWGSGKTFFVENFKHNFNKINKDKYFEEFIYIDAMEILEDKDVIIQLLEMISQSKTVLGEAVKDKFSKKDVAKGLAVGAGVVLNGFIDKMTGVNLKESYNAGRKTAKDNSDNEAKLEEKPIVLETRTLVFIDNLERIGKESKKILKIVYKLRVISNVYFILITNVSKMKNFIGEKENDDQEFPIYKFVNTSVFDFHQDYSSVILTNNSELAEDEINIINNCLNKTNNGIQLSIREFNDWAKENNFWKEENKFGRIIKLSQLENVDIKTTLVNEYSEAILEQKNHIIAIANEIEKIGNRIEEKQYSFYNIEEITEKLKFYSENEIEKRKSFFISDLSSKNIFAIVDEIYEQEENANNDIEALKSRSDDIKKEIKENEQNKASSIESRTLLKNKKEQLIEEKTQTHEVTIEAAINAYNLAESNEDAEEMGQQKHIREAAEKLRDGVNESNEISEIQKEIEGFSKNINFYNAEIDKLSKQNENISIAINFYMDDEGEKNIDSEDLKKLIDDYPDVIRDIDLRESNISYNLDIDDNSFVETVVDHIIEFSK